MDSSDNRDSEGEESELSDNSNTGYEDESAISSGHRTSFYSTVSRKASHGNDFMSLLLRYTLSPKDENFNKLFVKQKADKKFDLDDNEKEDEEDKS